MAYVDDQMARVHASQKLTEIRMSEKASILDYDWLSLMDANEVRVLRGLLHVESQEENDRLVAALELIASPSTVAGMHSDDRETKLQAIASSALPTHKHNG